jgi:hypothetical protein
MVNASIVDENRQGDLGIAFHRVSVQRRHVGIFVFVILRLCCPGPAQTTIRTKIKAATAAHFLAFIASSRRVQY